MAARKLANEVERCFKKVAEGVQAFEAIYDKIQQTSNPSQKEKLEDALKKEIKKLQRSRDQIKAWAATNDIKDKKPLLDNRKLIETQMEKFKAVEKEMKTKAYSKEGLALSSKLDPKEKEKQEASQFLQEMVDELEQQIEKAEAETETLNATVKKSKRDTGKAERIQELERITERHKWHIGKLELLLRALENGGVEAEQIKDLDDGIRYYVENNQEVDFMEDETLYDDLNLSEEEDLYGMVNEADRVSSQDTQSVQDDLAESEVRQASLGSSKSKGPSTSEASGTSIRRPSTQMKSPLPALATLHTTIPNTTNGVPANNMKPAPPPTRTPGEPLKYASAAAAAAASDKNGVGIAPLPPPPNASHGSSGLAPSSQGSRQSASASPSVSHTQPASSNPPGSQRPGASSSASHDGPSYIPLSTRSPALSHTSIVPPSTEAGSLPPTPALRKVEGVKQKPVPSDEAKGAPANTKASKDKSQDDQPLAINISQIANGESRSEDDESIYHLPSSLQDLLESFEATKKDIHSAPRAIDERLLAGSQATAPDAADAERPRHYKPQNPYPFTPHHYPQEPLSIFDDPRLYSRIETDTLFYAFYYRQGTYQQYLAAKALKQQSWRFHKQYQTWFQRHEEPKSITEDYEQGTYRFFDYESTWMNRRKADFKFAYKWLEDEVL